MGVRAGGVAWCGGLRQRGGSGGLDLGCSPRHAAAACRPRPALVCGACLGAAGELVVEGGFVKEGDDGVMTRGACA